jgi:hypothetical protein
MKESAVRMLSVVPALLENDMECVSAPPSLSARTVFVVPKSSPSARAMAVLHPFAEMAFCQNGLNRGKAPKAEGAGAHPPEFLRGRVMAQAACNDKSRS